MQNKNTGTCLLCDQQVEHRTALKHVKKCVDQQGSNLHLTVKFFINSQMKI